MTTEFSVRGIVSFVGDDRVRVVNDAIYDDALNDMTYGRRIGRYLRRFNWYYPHGKDQAKYESVLAREKTGESVERPPKPPCLDLAWAQFEHVALCRYISSYKRDCEQRRYSSEKSNEDGKNNRERAEPGESDYETKLYPLFSSEKEMADWGIGVGLYFQNLRAFAIICFVAGLVSIPNMNYYSSSEYSGSFHVDNENILFHWLMKTSQVCTRTEWRACPTCDVTDWGDFPRPQDRFGVSDREDEDLKFLKQNDCKVRFREGLIMWVTMIFVAVAVLYNCYRQKAVETEYDEAEQTASDYSIQVEHPPRDSREPEEWKRFFENNFTFEDHENIHVTCVTVVLHNQHLVDKLVSRRRLLLHMEINIKHGKIFKKDDLEAVVADSLPVARWRKLICRAKDAQTIKGEIETLSEEIKELQKETYGVAQVFVTFEHEKSQRKILEALAVSRSAIISKNTGVHSKNPGYLFRSKHLLSVVKPPEPSNIRWRDLDEKRMKKLRQQAYTYLATFIAIGVAAVIVYICNAYEIPFLGPYVITIMNQLVPTLINYLMEFEDHTTECSFEASHYVKLSLFRWVNTVIVLTLITPFTHTLQKGPYLLSTVCGLYFSEVTLIPVFNYFDFSGTLRRHLFGPRASNQRQMNLHFQGTKVYLADVYTGMSKVVFLCFWYANIFPAVYFLTTITLMVHYVSYKFAFMRSYRTGTKIGSKLAFMSRVFIFPTAVLFLFVQASYNWSSFPFDNTCETSTNATEAYIGEHSINLTYIDKEGVVFISDGIKESVNISEGDKTVEFCDQDMNGYIPKVFPTFPKYQKDGKEWMHDDQEWISIALGWSAIVVLACVIYHMVVHRLYKVAKSYFTAPYKTRSKVSRQSFSEVAEISAYIPMKRDEASIYPLLMCDISDIDHELIGWEDVRLGYNEHNLTKDIIPDEQDSTGKMNCFSIVKHWSPPNIKRRSSDPVS